MTHDRPKADALIISKYVLKLWKINFCWEEKKRVDDMAKRKEPRAKSKRCSAKQKVAELPPKKPPTRNQDTWNSDRRKEN